MNKVVGNGVDGRAFVKALDACKDKNEIFELLSKSMKNEDLRDRLRHISDQDEVNRFKDTVARLKIKPGHYTPREDLVVMSAKRYTDLTGKNIKFFKAECNKHITMKEAQKQKISENIKIAQVEKGM